jgi:hypothetical protein
MLKPRVLLLIALVTGLLALSLASGRASATAPPGSITIANQAQLLSDGTVVVTVSYTCAPAAGGVTTGDVGTSVQQGALIASGTGIATCDNRRQTAHIQNVPGPFSEGTANVVAFVINADSTSFAFTSRAVMVG